MCNVVYLDTETYSETSIKAGTYAYCFGPTTEVMLLTYAIDDGPVRCWDRTKTSLPPQDLISAVGVASRIVIHNSMFDRTVLRATGVMDLPTSLIVDTMVQAYAHSLPGSLGELSNIYGLTDKGKRDGGKLIQLFCKPRPRNMKLRRATRVTHPEEWEQFIEYAKHDVEAMRELHKRMPTWNLTKAEHQLWETDQFINDRGMPVDVALAEAAVRTMARRGDEIVAQTSDMTDGAIVSFTRRQATMDHILAAYGVQLADMKRSTITNMIADSDTPSELIPLLQLRLEASSTGATKYEAVLRAVNSDGRLRGTKQFCGAGRTGRWAGRVFQPDNLMRPTISKQAIENGIDALLADSLHILTHDPTPVVRSVVRGVIRAEPGYKLLVSDLSNIEGRIQAWLANETWKLDAFKAYDTVTGTDDKGKPIRSGADLYEIAFARSFDIPIGNVTELQRQIGKVMELALGYAGGANAFATMALGYNIDLDDMAERAWATFSPQLRADALGFTQWMEKNDPALSGLSVQVFAACTGLKIAWRNAHPNITALWKALADGAITVLTSNQVVTVGRLQIQKQGAWLTIKLPSGRYLCYPQAQWNERSKTLDYMGVNQFSRKWVRIETTGGKLFENICQAVARDVLAYPMPVIDKRLPIILTVHDEVVCEVPDTDEYSVSRLVEGMTKSVPTWTEGLPLAAKGFETYRYCKG